MFEEVKTINWKCDLCGAEVRVQNLWRNQLDRPDGWAIDGVGDPHSMGHYQLDVCSDCVQKRTPNA